MIIDRFLFFQLRGAGQFILKPFLCVRTIRPSGQGIMLYKIRRQIVSNLFQEGLLGNNNRMLVRQCKYALLGKLPFRVRSEARVNKFLLPYGRPDAPFKEFFSLITVFPEVLGIKKPAICPAGDQKKFIRGSDRTLKGSFLGNCK